MTDEGETLGARVFDESYDVLRQLVELVSGTPLRFVALVVTALVGDQNVVSGFGQRINLIPPAVPEFWESVEQNDEWPILGSRLGNVEFNSVCRLNAEANF